MRNYTEIFQTVKWIFILYMALPLTHFGIVADILAMWSAGVNKTNYVDQGVMVNLTCNLNPYNPSSSVYLSCPLSLGFCMENCMSMAETRRIQCTKKRNSYGDVSFIYTFNASLSFSQESGSSGNGLEGDWFCRQRSLKSNVLPLKLTDKPMIKSVRSSVATVSAGSSIVLTCESYPIRTEPNKPEGALTFAWRRRNSEEAFDSRMQTQENRWTSSLKLRNVTANRDESIVCEIKNGVGERDAQIISLNILYPPEKIVISAEPASPVVSGSLLTFKCTAVKGNPVPHLRLLRERVGTTAAEIPDTIIAERLDNKAGYFCEATGKGLFGDRVMKSEMIKIVVYYPPDEMSLKDSPPDRIRESETKQFICKASVAGNPELQFQWTHIDLQNRAQAINQSSFTNSSFQIKESMIYSETNQYSLFGRQSILTVVGSRHLNGHRFECLILYRSNPVWRKKLTLEVAFAPNNIRLNSNPLGGVAEGESMSVICSTSICHPPANIQWLAITETDTGQKEDRVPGARIVTSPSDFNSVTVQSRLTLNSLSRLKNGLFYRCVVTHPNFRENIVKDIALNVMYPPQIKVVTSPSNAQEGQSVDISCKTIGGNPSGQFSYNWFHFHPFLTPKFGLIGTSLDRLFQKSRELTDQHSAVLRIEKIGFKNIGHYWCEVISSGGKSTGHGKLDILYSPVLLPTSPKSISVKLYSPVTLTIQTMANPPHASAKWFRLRRIIPAAQTKKQIKHPNIRPDNSSSFKQNNYRVKREAYGDSSSASSFSNKFEDHMDKEMIANGRKFMVNSDGQMIFRLHISRTEPEDFGYYACEVTHAMGKKQFVILLSSEDLSSISMASLRVQSFGSRTVIHFEAPKSHYSHLVVRACPNMMNGPCTDHQVADPKSGEARFLLEKRTEQYSFRILVYNGPQLVYQTGTFKWTNEDEYSGSPFSKDLVIGMAVGGGLIAFLLGLIIIVTVIIKCNIKGKRAPIMSSGASQASSNRMRPEYMLIGDTESSFIGNSYRGCSPPIEMRSDNGSMHSYTQDTIQRALNRRKLREVDDVCSIKSGSSSQPPDVVLSDQNAPQQQSSRNSVSSSHATKCTLLSGRGGNNGHPMAASFSTDPNSFDMPPEYAIFNNDKMDPACMMQVMPMTNKQIIATPNGLFYCVPPNMAMPVNKAVPFGAGNLPPGLPRPIPARPPLSGRPESSRSSTSSSNYQYAGHYPLSRSGSSGLTSPGACSSGLPTPIATTPLRGQSLTPTGSLTENYNPGLGSDVNQHYVFSDAHLQQLQMMQQGDPRMMVTDQLNFPLGHDDGRPMAQTRQQYFQVDHQKLQQQQQQQKPKKLPELESNSTQQQQQHVLKSFSPPNRNSTNGSAPSTQNDQPNKMKTALNSTTDAATTTSNSSSEYSGMSSSTEHLSHKVEGVTTTPSAKNGEMDLRGANLQPEVTQQLANSDVYDVNEIQIGKTYSKQPKLCDNLNFPPPPPEMIENES